MVQEPSVVVSCLSMVWYGTLKFEKIGLNRKNKFNIEKKELYNVQSIIKLNL